MLPTSLPGGRPAGMTRPGPTSDSAARAWRLGMRAASSGVRPPSSSSATSAQPSGTNTTYFIRRCYAGRRALRLARPRVRPTRPPSASTARAGRCSARSRSSSSGIEGLERDDGNPPRDHRRADDDHVGAVDDGAPAPDFAKAKIKAHARHRRFGPAGRAGPASRTTTRCTSPTRSATSARSSAGTSRRPGCSTCAAR